MISGELLRQDLDFIEFYRNQDPRLAFALERSRAYVPNKNIAELDVASLATFVNEVQQGVYTQMREQFPQAKAENDTPGSVDPEKIDYLVRVMQNGGVGLIRHGKQALNFRTMQLSGTEQKRVMMLEPFNTIDRLTLGSFAEAVGEAIVWEYVAAVTGQPVSIISSMNTRAAQVAVLVADRTNARVRSDYRARCLSYPLNKTSKQTEKILGPENKGSLVWEEKGVDRLKGRGTYKRMTADTRAMVLEALQMGGIVLIYSHTQQKNIVDVWAGEDPSRCREFGGVFIQQDSVQDEISKERLPIVSMPNGVRS